jgi:uncharacterized protein
MPVAPNAGRSRHEGRSETLIVDADAHNWPLPADLEPYLSPRWRDYLEMIGLRSPSEVGLVRAKPLASRTDAWSPDGRVPGNDPEFFREDLLDRYGIRFAVINSLAMSQQALVGGNQPAAFTAELMHAANEWTREHFLDPDKRLYASICTAFEEGALAVREIEERGPDPRFVQVLLPFRTQRPAGNPKYWAMYEAAVEYDLPIAFHPGSIGNNPVTGAGWPSFYYEDHVGYPSSLMAQMASLVTEGVFERFPSLKIVLQEGGWSWVAPFCWRFDRAFEQLRAEVPHLSRRPSEYIEEHFWYTTQPIEEPETAQQFVEALEVFGHPERLLYSSDYPHWDFDAPTSVLPSAVDRRVTRDIMGPNACALYGFDATGDR